MNRYILLSRLHRQAVRTALWCALGGLLCLGPAWAAAPAGEGAALPMKVTSEKMTYNHADQTVTFEGQVVVDREDFRLTAQRIVVHLLRSGQQPGGAKSSGAAAAAAAQTGGQPGGKSPAESIDRIEAFGNVHMSREGKTGDCDNAVYQVAENVLTMRGNPVLREGTNQIQGETIKFYLKENRSEVLGGARSKVEATFTTPKGMKTP